MGQPFYDSTLMLSTSELLEFEVNRHAAAIGAAVRTVLRSDSHALKAFFGEYRPGAKAPTVNRRQVVRHAVKIPLSVVPVVSLGKTARQVEETRAIGLARDISPKGIGIAYDCALHSRFVVVEFDLYGGEEILLLTELRWARKRGPHDFIAGGRLVGVVTEVR